MRVFGLIGYPLSHSFSPGYFAQKFNEEGIQDASYDAFSIPTIEDFKSLVQAKQGLKGLNVTIPYKEQIIPFLDELSEEASIIGAVNTIHFKGDKRIGHNTDIFGFMNAIRPMLNGTEKKALVLGTGGSSKAVVLGLQKLGLEVQLVSRSASENLLSYDQLNESIIQDHLVIVNTTPLGMYPKVEAFPSIPYEALTSNHVLFDLVYNPEETLFLQKGKARGASIKNGLEMLHLQADASWEIWNK